MSHNPSDPSPAEDPSHDAPTLTVRCEQAPVGQVYLNDQPVMLAVRGPEAMITYHIVNAWGHATGGGTVRLQDGAGQITLSALEPGYYEVRVETDAGISAATRFLIVPPYDLAAVGETPFGVVTHFAQGWPTDLIEPLARLGIQHVRDEVYWDAVERQPGQYTFPSSYDEYMAKLDAHHMKALTPLTFGNPLYDPIPGVPNWAAAPYTDKGFAAYAEYGRAVLAHYGRRIGAVEIWNEYNGGFARGPADGRPEVYGKMLAKAYEAIKADRPDVLVLAGGTIGVPLDWLERMIQTAGMDHLDGISIHPYGYSFPPEYHARTLEALRALLRKYTRDRDLPIWVTEQGYHLIPPGAMGNRDPLTELTKARYLVRAWMLFSAHGVARTFWYLGRNDQHFGTMGLLGKPDDPAGRYAPLPAAAAYATMIRQIQDRPYAGQDALPASGYSLGFGSGDDVVRVMWALEPASVALECAQPLRVTDLFGKTMTIHPIAGAVRIGLSDSPLFVNGPVRSVRPDDLFVAAMPAHAAAEEPTPVIVTCRCNLPSAAAMRVDVGERCETLPPHQPVRMEATGSADGIERWAMVQVGRDPGQRLYHAARRALLKPALDLDRYPRLIAADRMQILITNNSSGQTRRLAEARWTLDGVEDHCHLDQEIPPGQQTVIHLAIRPVKSWTVTPVKVEVTTEDGRTLTADRPISWNPIRTPLKVVVDGNLDEWQGVEGIDLDRAHYVRLTADRAGPSDLGGRMMLASDDRCFYLAAEISDDVFDQTHRGYNIWKGDSLQLGISADPPWTGGEWRQPWTELGLALTPGGPEVYRFGGSGGGGLVAGARLVVVRQERLTIYECAIPWSALGMDNHVPPLKPWGFGVFVNDADGAGRKGYLEWGSVKSLAQMQPMTFKSL